MLLAPILKRMHQHSSREIGRQSEVRTKSTPLFSDRDNCFEKSRSSLRGEGRTAEWP